MGEPEPHPLTQKAQEIPDRPCKGPDVQTTHGKEMGGATALKGVDRIGGHRGPLSQQ
jgi:hypothetical protein